MSVERELPPDEAEDLVGTVRNIADAELALVAAVHERNETFPRGTFRMLGKHAARLRDRGPPYSGQVSIATLIATTRPCGSPLTLCRSWRSTSPGRWRSTDSPAAAGSWMTTTASNRSRPQSTRSTRLRTDAHASGWAHEWPGAEQVRVSAHEGGARVMLVAGAFGVSGRPFGMSIASWASTDSLPDQPEEPGPARWYW